MAKPHLILDARLYGPAHRGIGRYTAALADALTRYNPGYRLTALSGIDGAANVLAQQGWRVVAAPYRPYSWQEQIYLPRLLDSLSGDLYHSPHFNVSIFCSVPYVVTVHDLILHAFPNRRASTHSRLHYFAKYLAYRIIFRFTLLRARRTVAVTEFVAEDLRTRFPKNALAVSVIGEAETSLSATDNDEKVPYTSDEPYALVVGAFYPHKNIARLVRIWPAVHRETGIVLKLIGKRDTFAERIAEGVAATSAIQFMGEIADDAVQAFYKGAQAVIVPSLYEGYGLPGREAALADTLVISSSLGALPEVYGRGAVYVPVSADEPMQHALVTILKTKQYAARLPMPPAETRDTLAAKWYGVYESVLEELHAEK